MEHFIHVLDQSTVDKIAAGEVVERPASVVKELTENAIDAGATRITIEIRDGGITMIRITDNGKGIAPEDIPLAFLRHATSKIVTVKDLSSLSSLGFRGEALSSIAAVSRVEMITKRPEDLTATRYVIEGGREKLREEIGAPDGTTIIVRDIFYNTPARAKFLKTPMTEASHVASYVEQLVLSNPSIAFQFTVNGQVKLSSSGSGNLRDAIYHIYGRSIVSDLVEIKSEHDGISVSGYIGKPSISRGNRNYENYYVNGRYVKTKIVSSGIEDGFGNKLMQHQYPFACLFIDVSGSSVDVNVHPSKMEVRFSDEKKMYETIRDIVKGALDDLEMIPDASYIETYQKDKEEKKERNKETPKMQAFEGSAMKAAGNAEISRNTSGNPAPKSSEGTLKENQVKEKAPVYGTGKAYSSEQLFPTDQEIRENNKKVVTSEETETPTAETQKSPAGHYEQQSFLPRFLSKEASPMRRIVGVVFSTYWIFEYDNKMYMMDQHAAHERVLFERLMKKYHERKLSSQMLNPPILISLNTEEELLLKTYMEAFTALGFEIEPFGGHDYAIHAVPYDLGTIDSRELFVDLLSQLKRSQSIETLDVYIHRVATEACKAAVKGGRKLSVEEAKSLVDQLFECEDPYHCPHGRPTIISFTKSDLEKRFKRIV